MIFSTEVYFFTQYGVELIGEQFNWLEQDLKVRSCIMWIAVLHIPCDSMDINNRYYADIHALAQDHIVTTVYMGKFGR